MENIGVRRYIRKETKIKIILGLSIAISFIALIWELCHGPSYPSLPQYLSPPPF